MGFKELVGLHTIYFVELGEPDRDCLLLGGRPSGPIRMSLFRSPKTPRDGFLGSDHGHPLIYSGASGLVEASVEASFQ